MGRRSARKPGKTDRLDARAVALLVRQEASALPHVHAEDDTTVLDLLTSEREAAIAESTRLRNQIHALLLQTDPEYRAYLPTLKSQAALDALESYTAPGSNPLQARRRRRYAGSLGACDWRCRRPRSWLGRLGTWHGGAFPL